LEPGRSENNGIALSNKIFTYLLAGNAIIATSTRGQRPLMEKIPGAGLCYRSGDIQRLADQLQKWDDDREALLYARQCAWRFGEKDYNWEIEKSKLLVLVKKAFMHRIPK
jgi:hypothetical protein